MDTVRETFLDPRFFEFWEPPKSVKLHGGLSIAESIAAVKSCPTRFAIAQPVLGKAPAIGIIDTTGPTWAKQWVFRLDKPHGPIEYHHMNINPKLTGVRDPHVPIPGAVVVAGNAITTAVRYVGYATLVFAVAADSYCIGSAMAKDYKEKDTVIGENTTKTGAATAAGWGFGFLGASGGSSLGSAMGGSIGALFGGVGALPGAAIGGVLGGLVGGIALGVTGRAVVEKKLHEYYYNIGLQRKGFIFTLEDMSHLFILHNTTPKNEHEDEEQWIERISKEWISVLLDIINLFINAVREKNNEFALLSMRNLDDILPSFITCADFTLRGRALYRTRLLDTKQSNLQTICANNDVMNDFMQSKLIFHQNSVTQNINIVHELKEFFNDPLQTKDTFKLPSIKGEVLVMDLTGKALFWLNPSEGAKRTASMIKEKISSLETIYD